MSNLKWDGRSPEANGASATQAADIAKQIEDYFVSLDGTKEHKSEFLEGDHLLMAQTSYHENTGRGLGYHSLHWIQLVTFEGWLSAKRMALIVPQEQIETAKTKSLIEFFNRQFKQPHNHGIGKGQLLRPFKIEDNIHLCLPAHWIDERKDDDQYTSFFDPLDIGEMVSLSAEANYFSLPLDDCGNSLLPSRDEQIAILKGIGSEAEKERGATGLNIEVHPESQALWYEITNSEKSATRYWCIHTKLFKEPSVQAVIPLTLFIDHHVLDMEETSRLIELMKRELNLAAIHSPDGYPNPRPGRTFLPEPPVLYSPKDKGH